MTISIDQFLAGLERTLHELPLLLEEWDDIDPDLRQEYADQILTLLRNRDAMEILSTEEGRWLDVSARIRAFDDGILPFHEELASLMGIEFDDVVRHSFFAEFAHLVLAVEDISAGAVEAANDNKLALAA